MRNLTASFVAGALLAATAALSIGPAAAVPANPSVIASSVDGAAVQVKMTKKQMMMMKRKRMTTMKHKKMMRRTM